MIRAFDDLARLDPQTGRWILSQLDRQELIMALKGASKPICEAILSYGSPRMAEMLRDEMDKIGPVRTKRVEDAQKKILSIVSRMLKEGKITISSKVTKNNQKSEQYVVNVQLDEITPEANWNERNIWEEHLNDSRQHFRVDLSPFHFAELADIDNASLQEVLHKLDKKDLALVLKMANQKLRDKIFFNVSSRTAQLLREEMELTNPVDVKRVMEARRKIEKNILDMMRRLVVVLLKEK